MSAHNIQLFSGAVDIPDDLRVTSLTVGDGLMELGANGAFANVGYVMNNPGGSNAAVYYDKISDQLRVVHTDFGGKEDPNTVTIKNEDITLNVAGNTHSRFYYGDGGLLSNLVSDLQSVTAVEANSDQMIILSNATALWANVGNVLVEGNVTAGEFHGDGGWLTNVQTTFEETIVNGNATSNIVEFNNALSLVTTGNVGIQNVAPLGDLSIGANVVFDDDATDILKVQGGINCQTITIGEWVLGGGGSQGLQQITDTGHDTDVTVEFDNTTTAFKTVAKAGIGTSTPSSDAMLHVDGHVRLGGPADTPDNENMFVRAAGALNIIANHSNTDNTTSNLVMKAGEINAASITLAGAVTDDDRQKIVFKTRETEALTIDEHGNANFVSNVVVGTGAKFIGDGSGLTGLVSDLQSVSVGGATTNQTIKFTNATEGANITSNLYVGSNLHLDDVTLAAASVTLQGVTTNGATTTDAITITDTTEATTTSTGALKVSGGIAAAKDIRAANVVVNRIGVGLTAGANPDPAHLVEVDGNVKATNVICESLTLDSVALQTLYSLDQVVNVNNTTSNIVIISNTTPSTSMSTGCLQLSGGLGVNGNVYAQEFVNTNAGGWRLTHTHSTRPTVNGASVGGELTGGNGDVETGFLRLSGGGSTTGTGAPKSYIDICGASASTDFANNITFGIKGSEKVRLTDVGLGVGTVSPGYLLDVHGAANVGTLTTTGNVGVGTSSPNTLLELSKATGSATISPTELRLSTTTNAADWSVTDPWARLSFYTDDVTGDAPGVMASVGAVASSANGGENTRLAFFTAEPHVERMCIDRYGNVGIGTTSPGVKLHLYDSSSSTSHQMLSIENPHTFGFNAGQDTGSSIVYKSRWQGDGLSSTVDMCTIEGRKEHNANYGDSYISFKTRYETNRNTGGAGTLTEKLRIAGNGNVGIGTTNPASKLHVDNGVLVVRDTPETNTILLFPDGDGGAAYTNEHLIGNTHIGVAQFVSEQGDDASTIAIINKDRGNNTTKNASIGFFNTDTVGTGKYGGRIGFWPENSNATKQQFRIYTNPQIGLSGAGYDLPVQRMVVTGDGNVGIGTASPVSILHVRGTGQTSATSFDTSQTLGASIFVQSSDSVPGSGGSLVLGTYQGKFAAIKAGILNGTNNTVGNLHFMTRNATTDATLTNRMTITNTGNVGIGTNNPRCRLDVQGGGTRCSYPFGIGGTSTYATYTHTGVGGIANNAGSWTKDFVVGTYERGGWIRVYSGATKSGSAANGQVQNPKTAEFVYSIYGNSLYWNRVSGSTNISLSSSGYQTIRVSSSGGGSYNHGWVEIWQQGGVAIF